MAKIEIYTSPFCGFCFRAKSLLDEKGVDYEEINVMMSPGKRKEMIERAGATSVPQVFVDDQHMGDCNGIFALDASGELDAKLGVA